MAHLSDRCSDSSRPPLSGSRGANRPRPNDPCHRPETGAFCTFKTFRAAVSRWGFFALTLAFTASCSTLGIGGKTDSAPAATPAASAPASRGGQSGGGNGIQSFSAFLTDQTKVDEGLFTIYEKGDDLYYGIPDSLLDRDMLLVSRIAEVPSDYFGFFSAGSKTAEQVIRFTRQKDQVLVRRISYEEVADEELPVYQSVQANNFAPILASLPIKALTADSAGVVVEVTKFFESDIEAISGVVSFLRREYQVRRLDTDRSYIASARSFPQNVEVRHVMTYNASNPPSAQNTATISMLMSQSMVLLPEEPMRKRLHDYRVGWFTIEQIDYGLEEQKAASRQYIRRWRMEPSDPEAYARGELVEPVKPIVYYLDPATPEKYRPYVMQGVEDWQEAFEAAGFKNAIVAKLPPSPEEDPDWSPEDIRYSTVRWVASEIRNAVGPSVSDPRSGEIIESDIVWYHNHMRSYRNRLMIETGAANPAARALKLDDELIGETMRRVIAHEVGHALGLPHNMQSSSAYPVDSLRSGSFTQKYGIATTIMEYARQNYVAQPGDEGIRFIRQIGPYDLYSIEWGYRVIPGADTPEQEKPVLDSWIEAKAGDPIYRFASSTGYDPSAQTEDLSDDPVKASGYGLANLKRVVPNLLDWTATDGQGFDDLAEIYGELVGMWSRYARHVATNVGGVYQNRIASDQDGVVYTPVDPDYQRQAMEFLVEHAFSTPQWLLDTDILQRIEHAGAVERIQRLQSGILSAVMNPAVVYRLSEQAALQPRAYEPLDMLEDLRRGVWSELYQGGSIDAFRRALQRAYLERAAGVFELDTFGSGSSRFNVAESDVPAFVRAELVRIGRDAERAAQRAPDAATRAHLEDVAARVAHILDPAD